MKMLWKHLLNGSFILAFSLLLAGCLPGSMFYSPQEAALQNVKNMGGPNSVIDQSSIQLRQSVSMGRNTFVMISNSQWNVDHNEKCVSVSAVQQNNIGVWQPRGSGGGCTEIRPDTEESPAVPLDVMGGSGGGDGPNDPGYSYTYGLVNPTEKGEEITKVRVTWHDGQAQEVDVVNASYLAVRAGQFHFQKLEGLNASGDIVYNNEPPGVPGQP